MVPVFVPSEDSSVSAATLEENLHSEQVHFVPLQDRAEPARHQPQRFPEPREIVLRANLPPVPQRSKEPPLQRRQRHKRPIQIKKRRNSSALLPYLYLLYFFPPFHIDSRA